MQVVRDASWTVFLNDAVKMYRLKTPNDKCYKLADATWKFKQRYRDIKQKKEQTKIVVLDKAPDMSREQISKNKTCKAITMSGNVCSFKAVCGDFCRKHNKKEESVPDMDDIINQFGEIKIVD
jgi:hypothetical protein